MMKSAIKWLVEQASNLITFAFFTGFIASVWYVMCSHQSINQSIKSIMIFTNYMLTAIGALVGVSMIAEKSTKDSRKNQSWKDMSEEEFSELSAREIYTFLIKITGGLLAAIGLGSIAFSMLISLVR